MITDRYNRTVEIAVCVRPDGSVIRLEGEPLPRMSRVAIGRLIVPASAIANPDVLKELCAESVVDLVPVDSHVMVGVSTNMIDTKAIGPLAQFLSRPKGLIDEGGWQFVEVILKQPLKMRFRGSKSAQLENCSCTIPSLGKDAVSINHAFTLISKAFETERRSNSGNVFRRVFALVNGRWSRLDDLRTSAFFMEGLLSELNSPD